MKNMTNQTKKNISGNNSYNSTLNPNLNQRKYFIKIIVTVVYFKLIYSQSIILCEDPINNKNSELTKSESPKLYCTITVEADSFKTKILVTVFVKKSKTRSWFSCWENTNEENYYELQDQKGNTYDSGLIQLYNEEQESLDIIQDLLNYSKYFLKKQYNYYNTPLVFALTAGLRLFDEQSKAIVNKVNNILTEYHDAHNDAYQINENTVFIMNENNEGVYAWLTVNFMKNNLKDFDDTIAVLDLRDSSLQITFYVPHENLQHYDYRLLKKYTIMEIERHFYNQSHIDFGLMEMRIKILTINDNKSTYSSPCHLTSDNFSYTYLFKNYKITGSSPVNDIYTQCFTAVQSLITKNVNKVTIKQPIMAISFFYETAKVANLVHIH
ncbi:ectonucleoside triphosphate diphosphohydrolase 6-like isoform X2 [Melanaphis sacchari]|uniref:ectonucleoside triphosphate diphosphohydrolase 6-like isoform X2 n=1 Tax=Melanaphis sacchari TaxID=742174 RepID=UPI000DC12FF4|nr:ectonucleoside triphosphate diphosphohydrolase 6-like isoform X2 [Melanaphis sacchari]